MNTPPNVSERKAALRAFAFKWRREATNSWRQKKVGQKIQIVLICILIPILTFGFLLVNTDPRSKLDLNPQTFCLYLFWIGSELMYLSIISIVFVMVRGTRADGEQLLVTPLPQSLVVLFVYFSSKNLFNYLVLPILVIFPTIIFCLFNPESTFLLYYEIGAFGAFWILLLTIVPWVYYWGYKLRTSGPLAIGSFWQKIAHYFIFAVLLLAGLTAIPAFNGQSDLYLTIASSKFVQVLLFPSTIAVSFAKAIIDEHFLTALGFLFSGMAIGLLGLAKCNQFIGEIYDSIGNYAVLRAEVVRRKSNSRSNTLNGEVHPLYLGKRTIEPNKYLDIYMEKRWEGEIALFWLEIIHFFHVDIKKKIAGFLINLGFFMALLVILESTSSFDRSFFIVIVFFIIFQFGRITNYMAFRNSEFMGTLPFNSKEAIKYSLLFNFIQGQISVLIYAFASDLVLRFSVEAFAFLWIGMSFAAIFISLLNQTSILSKDGQPDSRALNLNGWSAIFAIVGVLIPIGIFYYLNLYLLYSDWISFASGFGVALLEIALIFAYNVRLFKKCDWV